MIINYITSARVPSERAYAYAISKLCEEWGKAGHAVRLIIPGRKHGMQDDVFEHYKLDRTFKIEKIRASDFVGARISSSRIRFALDLFSFVKSLRRMRFDVDTILYSREYLLALVLPSKNLYLEMHSLPNRGFLVRRALRRARGVIAISSGIRESLLALGVPEEKILVAHDGVDLDQFAKAHANREVWKEFGIDPSNRIVLYTGHFYDWKGANTLAEAGKAFGPDVHVVLMGGIDDELAAFQRKYASKNVHIAPHQPRERIPLFLKSADVLVLPNSAKAEISRKHASPLKLFEYMAAGVPIVASDVPSLREVLTDKTAYFFEPDNREGLAAIITQALSNRESSRANSIRAGELVKKYSWSARARSIGEFVENNI